MPGGFRTVGHSNRTLEAFVDILRDARVQEVADVRSFPRSRSNPDFNIDTLPDALRDHQIGYRHFPDLGGRRKIQRDVPVDINGLWRNRSFHNYADYALSDPYSRAYTELVASGNEHVVAIMCSEAVWWRCHRRIITDYLLRDGYEVLHLMGGGRKNPATPTLGSELTAEGQVVYPAEGKT